MKCKICKEEQISKVSNKHHWNIIKCCDKVQLDLNCKTGTIGLGMLFSYDTVDKELTVFNSNTFNIIEKIKLEPDKLDNKIKSLSQIGVFL